MRKLRNREVASMPELKVKAKPHVSEFSALEITATFPVWVQTLGIFAPISLTCTQIYWFSLRFSTSMKTLSSQYVRNLHLFKPKRDQKAQWWYWITVWLKVNTGVRIFTLAREALYFQATFPAQIFPPFLCFNSVLPYLDVSDQKARFLKGKWDRREENAR